MTEHEIQGQMVDALRAAGLVVLETTAYRQRGPSGVDRGVPDLLVFVPGVLGCVGLEVKAAKGRISVAQRELLNAGVIMVVRSVEDALLAVQVWLKSGRDAIQDAARCHAAGRVGRVWLSLSGGA